jgi:hypothetical protein
MKTAWLVMGTAATAFEKRKAARSNRGAVRVELDLQVSQSGPSFCLVSLGNSHFFGYPASIFNEFVSARHLPTFEFPAGAMGCGAMHGELMTMEPVEAGVWDEDTPLEFQRAQTDLRLVR